MFGKNLHSRVSTACILISIVPITIVAYQGYHCGRMAILDLTRLHVQSVAEARHTMIKIWLKERVDDISALISLPIVVSEVEKFRERQNAVSPEVLEGILRAQSHGGIYENLTILDADWNMLAELEPGLHRDSNFVTPTFRQLVWGSKQVYFGEAHIHEDHDVGVHLGSTITNPRGETVGYLVGNLNITTSLTPLLQDRSGLWRTGKAYIVDSDFRVLTEPFGNVTGTAFHAHSGASKQEPRAGEGTGNVHVYEDFLAHEVIGIALPFQAYGWAVVVEIDTDESMVWVRTLLFRAVLLLIAVLAAVISVSIWLSRLLGKPLTQLAAVTHRISEGYTNERLGPMNLEEAEEVRCAFNRMLDELRDKEEEIVRSATLATVGELTSRVVHEMRNPLSSVKMNFQALQRSVEQNPENQELAEIATSQLIRLESMLNELLQYGRPLELSWESVDVKSLFNAVVTETGESSLERQVDIDIEIQPGVEQIWVDVEQFKRVLVNLVKNAVEVSPIGGRVEIRARSADSPNENVLIEVTDTGSGIRGEHHDMLFKPFFTTKSEGIGLGLANVKKIVSLHSGLISARNGRSVGAVFTITIPRHAPFTDEI